VLVVDPYDLPELEKALTYAVRTNKPSVVITNKPCVLIKQGDRPAKTAVTQDRCTGCGMARFVPGEECDVPCPAAA